MRKFVFLTIISVAFNASAQWKDFGIWSQISIEKKWSPRFSSSVSESIRLSENATFLNTHFTHLSLSYKLSPKFALIAGFRNAQRFRFDETIDFRQRFQLDAVYSFKLGSFDFDLQERAQIQFENINRSDNWMIPEFYLRTRFTSSYSTSSRFTPFASAEIFHNVSDKQIDNLRLRIGSGFELNKHNQFKLFYMIDQDLNQNNPLSFFAFGSSYEYRF